MASAELYDPRSGKFSPTASMAVPRSGNTATLLPNGRVLVAGGWDGQGILPDLSSAEQYDPATGTFTPSGAMATVRAFHTATLLKNGRVLITGGMGDSYDSLASAELFDPTTGAFVATGSMLTGRDGASAALLPDGRVLVAGGYSRRCSDPQDSPTCSGGSLDTAEIYDPATGTFSPTGSMSAAMDQPVAAPLPDGRVLIAGGWVQNAVATAEIFDPVTGSFSKAPAMALDFADTATPLPDGRVLLAGQDNGGDELAELYLP